MWPTILSRATGAASVDGPSRTLFFWLMGAFLLTLLPHVTQMPSWLTASILIAAIVRCIAEWKRWPLPTTTSTGLVALCLLGGVFLQFHTVLGRDAGTPFMAGLLMIKFYELRGPRDITLIIFSSFFVVMSALLFSQAIELFVYCLIMMWLLTGILLRTYMGDRSSDHLLPMLRASSVIFLQALPLALLLFFFFPRYSGRVHINLNEAVTGLSDRVDPGSIAELADDDSPALRVYFLSRSVPTPDTMYMRAIVLWYFNGRSWTRTGPTAKGESVLADLPELQPEKVPDSDLIEQRIVISPQNQRWLPALDRATSLAKDSDTGAEWSEVLTGDILVAPAGQVIDYKRQYRVTSSSITEEDQTPSAQLKLELSIATKLPAKIDPRVQALADQLFAPNHETIAYVNAVLHYFRAHGFRLSTSPGQIVGDPVAEFLFRTKSGFCEHYASAFGELMRLEKVPTRMVVGYHGGEWNSYGGFYQINQANAHAWDEVWLEDKKEWRRVDPTSVITAGSSAAIAANEGLASDDDLSFQLADRRYTLLSGKELPRWMQNGLRDFGMRRQEMEAQWDDWVFSYDPSAQDRLAQALGLGRYAGMTLLGVCVAIAGFGAAAVAFFLARKKSISPVEDFYVRFCRRMAQRGAPRELWEGPLASPERLAARFPAQKEPIEEAGWIVAEHRYSADVKEPHGDLQSLLQAASERS
jgi:protein-glutamine gamma-glutamyltransferase